MHKAVAFVAFAVATWCAVAANADADDIRVEVATLDGAPVYHWRPFKSVLSDDVDRALVLREFQRKSFRVPPRLVDAAIARTTTENFGGDAGKLAQALRKEGASPEDFRRFTTEEIMVRAMLHQQARSRDDAKRLQAEWLAKLRAGATVKRLPVKSEG